LGRTPGAFAAVVAVSPSPKALLGDLVGLLLGFVVVLAALVFLALARLGGLALGLLDGVALRADLGLFLGDLALFGLAQAGIAERVGAAVSLFSVSVRSTTPDAFGARRRGAGRGRGGAGLAAGGGAGAWRRARGARSRRGGLGLAVGRDAALLDLDDHLLAAAMAEALAHHAGLGARLERQRRLSDAQRFAVRGLGVRHSVLESCQFRSRPCRLGPFAGPKALKARKRAKNVSFAGPASRAACTTFDRPNAKSNWAVVKALMTRSVGVVRAPQRAGELGDAVGAGIDRMHQAHDVSRAIAASALAKPAATSPDFPRIASASSADRTSRRSVCRPVPA
jgi:hypothetical protein